MGNVLPLRYLIRHLLGAPSGTFSVNRFYNDLKSQDVAASKNTLHDFLARRSGEAPQAIQVAVTIADPGTRERELRALEAAMVEREVSRATLVTLDDEQQIETPSGPVQVLPVWRWLLRDE